MPLQVDVVEAGAAVEYSAVDDQPLEVHHAQDFAPLHRNAVNRHARPESFGHLLIKRRVAGRTRFADQAALGAMPIDENGDLQLRLRRLGRVERAQNFPPTVVVLQVERRDQNALPRLADQRQQGLAEGHRVVERTDVGRGDRDARQVGERRAAVGAAAPAPPRRGEAGGSGHWSERVIHGAIIPAGALCRSLAIAGSARAWSGAVVRSPFS